jgi:AcrR family transcriptional regulator
MSHSETFSKRLRELRGEVTIKDLAKRAGVATSALYNAEGEKPVSWKTVEKAYGPLCAGQQQIVHLLTLWALTQTSKPIGLYDLAQMMNSVVREESSKTDREDEEMLRAMSDMTLPERQTLLRFARHFAGNAATKNMVNAWMEGVEG